MSCPPAFVEPKASLIGRKPPDGAPVNLLELRLQADPDNIQRNRHNWSEKHWLTEHQPNSCITL